MELVKRLLSCFLQEPHSTCSILFQIESYIAFLQTHLTREHFLRLSCRDRTEFFYQPLGLPHVSMDRECLKLVIQIFFTSLMDCGTDAAVIDAIELIAKRADDAAFRRDEALDVLFDLCANNDETLSRLQRDILDLYTRSLPEHLRLLFTSMEITPHTLFLYFLNWTGFNHEILVDLLMSGETEFLEFFVKYLKYVHQEPQPFMAVLHEKQAAESVDGVLWRLVGVLTAGEFPYNPSVLVNRIHHVLEHIENVDEEH